jgi:NAD(P)-dependent dehydrogenase (short-subunit alcohol dehydrogenase family)
MQQLNGKVVLITGANGGLGRHVVPEFVRAGATVAAVSLDISAKDFPDPRVHPFPAELSDGASAAAVVQEIKRNLGRIDVLVHLVGGFLMGGKVGDTDESVLETMLTLNLRSTFHMARAVLPVMQEQGGGRILAISSRAAAGPAPNVAAYAASKAALTNLVQSIAAEYTASGVTAAGVAPGTMDTAGTGELKHIPPQKVAALLAFLASDAGTIVNGTVVPLFGKDL